MINSDKVFNDAQSLLEESAILETFHPLGTVYMVGSYAARLMWDPDIDIIVVTKTPQASAIQAISLLAKSAKFQKIEFGDFKNFPCKNRPRSYIVNARTKWKGQIWEIETWFVNKLGDQLDVVEKLKKLSEKDKQKIVALKKQRSLLKKSKHDQSSWDIYQQFINKK